MYKLSPSDFRYLWEDCPHCYYQKVKLGILLPSIGIPGVFMKMNSLLQAAIQGKNLREISSLLPAGLIEVKEGFLKSQPVPSAKDCFISGRFDILSTLDDGSYAVIDFKITDPKEEKVQKFSHQLHAYKFALENPLAGPARKVSKMGLVVVSPQSIEFNGTDVIFKTTPQWYEISENMAGFLNFIAQVSKLLNGTLPTASENCAWCQYRNQFHQPPSQEPLENRLPF